MGTRLLAGDSESGPGWPGRGQLQWHQGTVHECRRLRPMHTPVCPPSPLGNETALLWFAKRSDGKLSWYLQAVPQGSITEFKGNIGSV